MLSSWSIYASPPNDDGGGGWPPNPYDFSAPARTDVFAAREPELKAFSRFGASISSDRSAHLLIHGRRGIGKTSLLGQLRKELESRDLVVAWISASVDDELGPMRVVRFWPARPTDRIPDQSVSRDLSELIDAAREIDRVGVVLVVDEADKLLDDPSALQRMRNQLVLPGLISTVLCGTDKLVDGLDTALAPMGRHYEKLELRPLADSSETQRLLDKPLRFAGLAGRDLLPSGLATEIHQLTLGSPYEIALLAHVMYEDMVAREASELELNERVLEQVAAQLRPSADDQAALTILRELGASDLSLTARYCVDPSLTLQEHALLRVAFEEPNPGVVAAARSAVASEWDRLKDLHLGHRNDEFLKSDFGELSRLYLKYKARVLGVLPESAEGSYSERLSALIRQRLVSALPVASAVATTWRSRVDIVDGRPTVISAEFDKARTTDLDSLVADQSLLSFMALEISGNRSHWPLGSPPSKEALDGATPIDFVLVPYEVGEDGYVWIAALADANAEIAPEAMLDTLRRVFPGDGAIPS